MYKLFFDTETTGLDPKKHFILTAYFAICDENLNVIADLNLKLKPESMDGLEVTKEAMNVNKINLEDHLSNPNTIVYKEGKRLILEMLSQYKIKGKRQSYQPAGHNIDFDKGFVFQHLMPREEWEKMIHYRTLDTSHVTSFLKDVGILPDNLGSLTSLVEYFKITMKEAHTAKGDVLMNIDVYKHIKRMMSSHKQNSINVDKNLLSIIEM